MSERNNLPEIDLARINRGKKKKKGFIPWLGGAGGPGASGGLGGLFAGKSAALVATLVITGLAVGAGLVVSNFGGKPAETSKVFHSQDIGAPVGDASRQYVPMAQRRREGGVSSLAMFAEENKGKVVGVGDAVSGESQRDEEQESDASAEDPQFPAADEMAKQLVGKLVGSQMGELSSQLGGGNNRFKGWGGRFGNKFGNTFGTKGIDSDGVMGSFHRPTLRKSKLLSMRRPRAISGRRSAMSHKGGLKGSHAQAKAIKSQQKNYTGANIDSAKSTQDKAWESTTGGGGLDAGGGGIGSGGAGLVSSPSLDNLNQQVGGGGDADSYDYATPDTNPSDVSPWAELVKWANIMLMIANLLIIIVSLMAKIANILMSNPWTAAGGAALKVKAAYIALYIAGTLGAAVAACGVLLMVQHGQMLAGAIFTIAGSVTAATAFMALAGVEMFCNNMLVLAAVSSVIQLIGSFMTAPKS